MGENHWLGWYMSACSVGRRWCLWGPPLRQVRMRYWWYVGGKLVVRWWYVGGTLVVRWVVLKYWIMIVVAEAGKLAEHSTRSHNKLAAAAASASCWL
jgi:hypothetical protein